MIVAPTLRCRVDSVTARAPPRGRECLCHGITGLRDSRFGLARPVIMNAQQRSTRSPLNLKCALM